MKTILKYRLDASGSDTSLTLTDGFRVVRTEYIPAENRVHLWVEVPLKAGTPESRVEFRVIASGQPIGDDFGYVGTALDTHAPEAYHVFSRFAGQQAGQPSASDGGRLVRVA
ncbi:DUF7352 domain-containing protein [Vreelandella utahensis]|uniref:DUF7352 domain-containing protein n=1 Tax=Vreelandella halophila TaxID=86177 RepID=UPI0009857B3E|nr:hypothetical protein [Halomonas utahensis]